MKTQVEIRQATKEPKMKRYEVYEYKDGDLCWVWTHVGLKEAKRLAQESYLAGMEMVRVVDTETGVVEYTIGEQ